MRTRAFAIGGLLVGAVFAAAKIGSGPSPSTRPLVVRVGEVAEADVDYKLGFACDNPAILRAWMLTRGQHNWFFVQGLVPGRTSCRVGTVPVLPSYLFDVVVQPKQALRR